MNKKSFGFIRQTLTVLLISLSFIFTTDIQAQDRKGELLGYIIIPDIVQSMEKMGKIAAAVDPAKFNQESFKAMAGAMLGDPALDNIDRTLPSVIMLFHNSTGTDAAGTGLSGLEFAAVIPVRDRSRYMNMLGMMNIPFEVNGNRLIISSKKSSLFFAQREMKFYRGLSSQKYSSDARVLIKIDSIMSAYSSEIKQALTQLQALESSGAFSGVNDLNTPFLTMGKLFAYAILDLAQQSKNYQLDLTFNERTVEYSSEYSAISDTVLSRFFDGEPQGVNRCLPLLPGKGQLTYAGYFDTKRFRDFIESLIEGAVKHDPSIDTHINRDLVDSYLDFTDLYTGEFAVTYGFSSSNILQMNVAASTGNSVEDFNAANDRFMAIYNEVLKRMSPGSGFTGYIVQKNFRKSSGVDVHRYMIDMENAQMTDAEKEMLRKMFGTDFSMEYAVSNGYVVASTVPENLDKIIINTVSHPSGEELLSMKAFGPGMDSYIDFDMIGFIESIMIMTGETAKAENDPGIEKLQTVMKGLDAGERNVLFSSKYSKGTSFSKGQVSVKMITEMIKVSLELSRQKSDIENTEEMQPEYENGE